MPHTPLFRYAIASLMFGMSLLGGCSCSGSDDVQVIQQDSYGQQLIDLDAAYKQGLLSEKEYKNSREAILDKMH